MGSRLDKLRQVNLAATKDESPLVEALKRAGVKRAWRTEGDAKENRRLGDVQFDHPEYSSAEQWADSVCAFSVEAQVAKKGNVNFSYSVGKVDQYRGRCYDNAYTLLGCSEKKDGDEMIFAVIPAKALHALLPEKQPNIYWKDGYWVIRPEALCSREDVIFGASIDEVAQQLVEKITRE